MKKAYKVVYIRGYDDGAYVSPWHGTVYIPGTSLKVHLNEYELSAARSDAECAPGLNLYKHFKDARNEARSWRGGMAILLVHYEEEDVFHSPFGSDNRLRVRALKVIGRVNQRTGKLLKRKR